MTDPCYISKDLVTNSVLSSLPKIVDNATEIHTEYLARSRGDRKISIALVYIRFVNAECLDLIQRLGFQESHWYTHPLTFTSS